MSNGANPFAKFALRAPTTADKPVKVPRTAALTGKKATKPKPFKPKGEDDAEEKKVVVKDTGFILWLKEGNGARDSYMEAREYLMRGPPFKGTSAFDAKEKLKDQGAKWVPNPLKVKGAKDGIVGGWWSAWDERALESLVSVPMGDDGRRQWTAVDVPPEYNVNIVRLMREYEVSDAESRRIAEDAARRARDAKEDAKAALRAGEGIEPDLDVDLAAFKLKYGIEPTESMLAASARAPNFGPQVGISRIRRLNRALHLKIVTVEQARTLDFFNDRWSKKRNRDESTDATAVVAAGPSEPEFTDYTKMKVAGPSSGCFMFGKGPGMIPMPTDAEWEQLTRKGTAREMKKIKPLPDGYVMRTHRRTYCESCVGEIHEQFGDCSCMKDGTNREWVWCEECFTATCGSQACECKSKSNEEWAHRQNKTCAEAKRRSDAAAAEASDQQGGEDGNNANDAWSSPRVGASMPDDEYDVEDGAVAMHNWLGIET